MPYPPGGGTDVIARIVQERFQHALGQPIVIDNRGGAAGSLGTDIVAKSPADGYTVLFTLSSHTINPSFYTKLPFDTAKDFEPVGTVASLPQILVANLQFPANTVAELVALAKAKPGTISFASVGNGSPGHLAGELLKLRTGTQMTHIPYRGGGPAVTDVMGGQVPLLWVSIPAAAGFVKQGKLKALAVSTVKRSAAFPDVPTMQEAGVRRLRGRLVVRDVRAGEDAEAGRRAPQQGAERGRRRARDQGEAARARQRRRRRRARCARQGRQPRARQMGQAGEGSESEGGVTLPSRSQENR